jgi:SAM-dependent methyltransferase
MRLRRRRPPRYEALLDLTARSAPTGRIAGSEVTDMLYERSGEARPAASDAEARRQALAALAGTEHTELSAVVPPADVHAMTRGAEHLIGGFRHADLVVAALRHTGAELRPGGRALDFGCSSGRVVRALAAAYPEIEWHGCDPNRGAIGWARANLPAVAFEVAPQDPPLPHAAAAFDFVLAISIWSHYGPGLAVAWLEEMHRVIKPGGHLVLTAHGAHSIAHFAHHQMRGDSLLARATAALYADGHFFHDEFGPPGDDGIVHPEWGLAFFTLEWLAARATPEWEIALHAAGGAEGNQDVIVLHRR